MSDNITYIINIFLDSVPIFIGYFIVNNDVTPNIVEFYENGNPNNILAPVGSWGQNNNIFWSPPTPFDASGVSITTMSYYNGNYGINNVPPPNGDGTYHLALFGTLYGFNTGLIANFPDSRYTFTLSQYTPPPPPTPIVTLDCLMTPKCRFCYNYKPPGPVEPICTPVVCATNQLLSTISMIPAITNNSTRTTESALLQATVKKQQQTIEQQTTNSTIQSTIANSAAINQNVFSQLIDLKNQRYAPYQPYIYPVVPPSVIELQMRTANVGVGVAPDTIMNCRGSQFVTT